MPELRSVDFPQLLIQLANHNAHFCVPNLGARSVLEKNSREYPVLENTPSNHICRRVGFQLEFDKIGEDVT